MRYFFTADQHYGHRKIIEYCNRPFADVDEMDAAIIARHNEIVTPQDIVINVGDFSLIPHARLVHRIIGKLNGQQVFLRGSHDRWLTGRTVRDIWEKRINDQVVVACHYAMCTWPKSHYGSWHVFGHSHGKLKLRGNRYDVGVDNNNFYPVSFETLSELMLGAGCTETKVSDSDEYPTLEDKYSTKIYTAEGPIKPAQWIDMEIQGRLSENL